MYDNLLEGLPLTRPHVREGSNHIYQMYTVLFGNNRQREKIRNHLSAKRIMTKVYFDCIHLTSYYSEKFNIGPGLFPTAENLSSRVLTLPIYPDIRGDEIRLVCQEIKKAID